MKITARLAATVLATMATIGVSSAARAEVDHPVLARSFLEAFDRADSSPDDIDFGGFLSEEFVQVQLGLFDIYLPHPSLADGDSSDEFKRVVKALLQAQGRWLEWLQVEEAEADAAQAEIKALTRWIKSWKPGKWTFAADGPRLALDLSEGSEDARAASESFAQRMRRGTALGLDREEGKREAIILIPDRGHFVEAIAFAGWLRSDLRSNFWKDGTHTWTNFYLEEYKVLALAFASPGGSAREYGASMEMSERTPTGLEQQIVQLATNSMIDNYYGSKIPPTFAGGLAINLVVDLFDECNTRADGDLSERRTEAVEFFVPGGNPSGGSLGTISADSRWRADQGSDRFVRVLRTSQKSGAGEMKKKGKLNFFEIQDDAGSDKKILSAPFLGAGAASRQALPAAFEGEQLEFLRAYRCAFLWWLQNESMGKEKASRAAFADFLKRLAQIDSAADIEASFGESFAGRELSSEELDRKGDLEGRFLYWLSKKKR